MFDRFETMRLLEVKTLDSKQSGTKKLDFQNKFTRKSTYRV